MNRPQPEDYPTWGENYISKVNGDIIEILEEQAFTIPLLFESNKEKENFAYAAGKWTLKQMLGHIIDCERIFVYRMTCFARNEQQHLPGFEEDNYVTSASFNERNYEDMIGEFAALRKANLYFFKSLNAAELARKGVASGLEITVKSILFIAAGHIIHHAGILKERYHVV